jgi:capsular polysaccharide biosynthesis protein
MFKKHRSLAIIIFSGLILALISLGVSIFLPRQFSAESQVLIMPRDQFGTDQFTQLKSAEQVGESLTQIIHTTDFYKKVIDDSETTFNKEKWTAMVERSRRKKWQKDIVASMVYGTSIMRIVAYSDTQDDAMDMSRAVARILSARAFEYAGSNITVKIVSDPLVSRWPARPNLILNVGVGFIVGAFFGIFWVLIKHKKHHLLFD